MTFAESILAPWMLVLCGVLSLLVLIYSALGYPWRSLLADSGQQHRLMAAAVAIVLLWQLRAQAVDWLSLHLVFTALLTLVFRAPPALAVNLVVNVAMVAIGKVAWPLLGVNVLISGVIPAWVTGWVWRCVDRSLPDSLPVFLFVCGFFGVALATLVAGLATVGIVFLGNSDPQAWFLVREYALFLPLLMPAEAFISGMLLSLLLVYHPHWVATFNAHRYIDTK
ncbi:energy-coupling factor ABC transporter permease [Onishia niordana]|uniref:energy-coupling factor ABC transporter permease n=1 Tax=Onishia niordana TaxID=2508711 RepID=UPI0010A0A1C3|nr:energy-coupling factor ABC transporter permease [Halomonas niordiana]